MLAACWLLTPTSMWAGPQGLVEALRAKSQSHVRIGDSTVFLDADDEVVSQCPASGCSCDEGARMWHGHYELVHVRAKRIVGRLQVGERYFDVGRRHDGLHVVSLPDVRRLLAIYRYGSCAMSELFLFRLARHGGVKPVPLVDTDGSTREFTGVSHSEMLADRQRRATLCAYDNAHALTWCDAFRFDGVRLAVVDHWVLSNKEMEPISAWPRWSQRAHTRWIAFQFGDALTTGYAENAEYFDGSQRELERRFHDGCLNGNWTAPMTDIADAPSSGSAGGFAFDIITHGASFTVDVVSTARGLCVRRPSDCRRSGD